MIEKQAIGGLMTALLIAGTAASMRAAVEASAPQVDVALALDRTQITFHGDGECVFSDAATIYDKPVTMWSVRQRAGEQDLNVTLWQPHQESGMITLFLRAGGRLHRVSTVKVHQQGEIRGSGQLSGARKGAGFVLTLDAMADTGSHISGRIVCSSFTAPEDNG